MTDELVSTPLSVWVTTFVILIVLGVVVAGLVLVLGVDPFLLLAGTLPDHA